jgi:hypothetical protein
MYFYPRAFPVDVFEYSLSASQYLFQFPFLYLDRLPEDGDRLVVARTAIQDWYRTRGHRTTLGKLDNN